MAGTSPILTTVIVYLYSQIHIFSCYALQFFQLYCVSGPLQAWQADTSPLFECIMLQIRYGFKY